MTAEPAWRAALCSFVMLKLRTLGPMTNKELANACQVREKAIAPRLTKLAEIGEVRDTGRRKTPASGRGRKQVVWEAVE